MRASLQKIGLIDMYRTNGRSSKQLPYSISELYDFRNVSHAAFSTAHSKSNTIPQIKIPHTLPTPDEPDNVVGENWLKAVTEGFQENVRRDQTRTELNFNVAFPWTFLVPNVLVGPKCQFLIGAWSTWVKYCIALQFPKYIGELRSFRTLDAKRHISIWCSLFAIAY